MWILRSALLLLVICLIVVVGGSRATAAPSGSVTVTGQGTNTTTLPTVTSADPNIGSRGVLDLEVTVSGTYFIGATSVDFGAGITVNSFTVDGDTEITAYMDIDPAATPGVRDITVTNLAGPGVGTGLFTISSLPGPPTNFQVVKSGPDSAGLTWGLGSGAVTTVIRGKEGSYPTDVSDGYEVYNSTGISTLSSGLSFNFSTYYYRAWSHNADGYSTSYVEGKIGGGGVFMLIGLVALCIGLGFFAYKVRFIVVSIASGIAWLVLATVTATDPGTVGLDTLGSNLCYLIAMVFLLMAFTPLLFQMRTDIKHESLVRGHPDRDGYPGAGTESWTDWGPKHKKGGETSDDRQRDYKAELRKRTGRK